MSVFLLDDLFSTKKQLKANQSLPEEDDEEHEKIGHGLLMKKDGTSQPCDDMGKYYTRIQDKYRKHSALCFAG